MFDAVVAIWSMSDVGWSGSFECKGLSGGNHAGYTSSSGADDRNPSGRSRQRKRGRSTELRVRRVSRPA